jgi:hypothetical protein
MTYEKGTKFTEARTGEETQNKGKKTSKKWCRFEIYRKENKKSSTADISMTYREETQRREKTTKK